ncbi:MAG: tetratricopeptide repeat protein [Phycisphaerales bacterium]
MPGSRVERAAEVFAAAAELPRGERTRYLARACGDDADLLVEVRSLLTADAGASGFLEPAPLDAAPVPTLAPGTRVGSYRLTRVIGAGGMGTVYEAEQDRPRRTVALKVLKSGLSSPGARRRFEYESQVLARLRHPGIAQVFEAGEFSPGPGPPVPYFAMELIPGARAITDFARERGFDRAPRLLLFAQVCDAVQHAHRHGVIHRDLKPANILVEWGGESAAPKVIDFGVARSGGPDSSHPDTVAGHFVGTIRYMSPEQCAGDAARVDVRADVYALGVVLYELLTGRAPYDLDDSGLLDAARTIRETPAVRPASLDPGLRGDLETILLKALEKEPERRYQSAADLARDLRHTLAREPIEARRHQGWYVLRRTLRRHWLPAAAAAVIATITVASSVALTFMYARQGRLLTTAERRADETRRALDWLRGVLASLDPARTRWGDTSLLRAMLDNAVARVGPELADQPRAEADMRQTLAHLYQTIGAFADAQTQYERAAVLRRAEGRDTPELADCLDGFGGLLLDRSRYADAAMVFDEALAIRRRIFGPTHPLAARSLLRMSTIAHTRRDYPAAERIAVEAVDLLCTSLGESDPATARAMVQLGAMRFTTGDLDGAEDVLRRAIAAFGAAPSQHHAESASALTNLAKVLHARGDAPSLAAAEGAFRDAVRIDEQLYGPEHPDVAWCRHRLGNLLHDLGRDSEAEPMLEDALQQYRRFLGNDDPYTAFTLESLGTLRMHAGRFAEARAAFDDALRAWDGAQSTGQPLSDWRFNRLGCLLHLCGDDEAAEPLLRRALAERDHQTADARPHVLESLRCLAALLERAGRAAEAAIWRTEIDRWSGAR